MSDQDKDIDALRIELERERMRLAACGVFAMSNTRETVKVNRQVRDEYRSASLDDVCAAVDREMALRERVAELEAQNHALKRQRDEARRRVCELSLFKNIVYRKLDGVDGRFIACTTPEEVAQVYDWDCFAQKEGGGA